MPKRKHGFGWKRDLPDPRDRSYGPRTTTLEPGLLKEVDLREIRNAKDQHVMPGIFNQSALGSCTSNAGNAVVQFVERLHGDPDSDRLSRLWTYYYTRLLEGTEKVDAGATIRNTFKTLANRGAPRERYWPYKIERFDEEPTAGERSAPHHRVLEYRRINEQSEFDMRACLSENYPFAYGFAVYESFDSVGSDGIYDPKPGEELIGYHAVMACGYDDEFEYTRNSWGTSWGDEGYFRSPRGFWVREAFDVWTIRKVTLDPVPVT